MVTKRALRKNGTVLEQHVLFNKKPVHSLDSFYKQNEKELTIPTPNSFIEISKTQP